MSGLTSRVGLYLPGGGSLGVYGSDEPVDVDKINGNFKVIDGGLGIPTYTSTTRPAAGVRFTDMVIYEKDTDSYKRWNGSAWVNGLPNYLTSSVLDSRYPTWDSLGNGGSLDTRYYTQTQLLTGGVLDSRYSLKAVGTQLAEYADFSSQLSAPGAISAGWSANRLILKRRAGFLMQIDVSLTRTGGSLSGNLTNARILNLSGGYGSATYQALSSGPGGNPNALYVNGTGVYLASIAPTTSIDTGKEMTICGNWIQS